MDKYVSQIKCKNCKTFSWHQIDKGVTVKEYLKEKICENCENPFIDDE
jgi:uncharacterized CHY-type Zn-finger protein